ncbi:HTH-type transcriptional regulator LeuO [Buttiauxella agrestis]|uniref:HTH-type transcriptional regulator LeuO n=1 Tax=Buttiauxella agrestis TaxID=82977 RepID=A0A381KQ66_9ENTR|nr:hypothetical protein [Buttiauxella agrestis]SUY92947.1 HTH-type transcriptional regulator LeuO [Buttiauxella agrestis]
MKSLRQELVQINKNKQGLKNKKLDLNLLPVFVKMFNDYSMMKKYDVIDMSFFSTSCPLNKLRDYFDDPLFIRKGRSLIATSFAEELYALINKELTILLVNIQNVSRSSEME